MAYAAGLKGSNSSKQAGTSNRRRSKAVRKSAWFAADVLEQRRMLSVVFNDDYSTDSSANYVETQQAPPPGFTDSWTVANGTLNYAVAANNGWNTSVYLVKPTVASTARQTVTTTSGDIKAPVNYQAGLILSGDTNSGGFVVAEYDNGAFNNHLVLLRETGGQLVGDEGGTGVPIPVLADFGDISMNNTDTFHISGTIDRTGANPVITVNITDLTTPSFTITPQTVTDTTDPANYGGNQIGWRARFSNASAVFSVDNLHLENTVPSADHAPATPTNLTATQAANSTNINLSWTNPGDNIFEFFVDRTTDGVNWTQIATVPSVPQNGTATYTDPISSPPGQTFLYRVEAANGFHGFTVSNPSNVASLTIGSLSSPNFTDTYTTDTTANYTETSQNAAPAQADTWAVSGGTLNYSIQATPGWNTSLFLLKPSIANTTGMYKFTTSGDIIAPSTYQPGLVLSGDPANGGFVVEDLQNGALTNHLVLLRETGAQLTGDEGGIGNPPVLADLGDITANPMDTFHIAGTIDRSGAHPVITVSVTDLTTPSVTIPTKTITDTGDSGYYGGTQIGWRIRTNNIAATVSFDNLSLQQIALTSAAHAPAAPTNLTGSELSGVVTLHWTNNADNATDFIVQRSTNPVGGFASLADVTPGAQGSTMTFTDTPPGISGTTFYYRVVAFNGFAGGTLSAPSNVVGVTLTNPAGATATYYNHGFWSGAPVDTQNVSTIDYSDPNGAAGDPTKVTNTGDNSVIYTGQIKIATAGTYTFIGNTSEDGYLYVAGVLVSNDPGDHPQENSPNVTPLTLAVGQYDFVFMQTWARYVGQDGSEGAHLLWVTPTNATPTLIPPNAMVPSSDTPAVPSAPVVDSTTPPTANSIDLTFTANNNAVVHYQLQRSGDGGTTWATISQIDPGSNSQNAGVPGTSVTMKVEDAAPVQGASYQYRVIAVGATASSAPSPASASVAVPVYAVSASTPGVEAHYFNAELWKTGSPTQFGQPDEFQVPFPSANNGSIDVALGGNASPDLNAYPDLPRIHPISYSAIFTGRILTDAAGVYTFTSNSDDDGYFYVNGILVSSDPGGHGPEEPPAGNIHPITLAANTAYDFVFLFNQQAGGSAYHAEWVEPGFTRVPIPQATPGSSGGFLQSSDTPHQITVDPATGLVTSNPAGSAAGGLTATGATGGITLGWTDQSTSEIWFEVQRGTSATGPFTTIGTAGMNATSFTDTTAVSGTHYFYRVRGVNYDGVGPYSNVGDATAGGVVSNTVNGTAGNDTITIKKDADGTHDDIWLNVATTGAPSQQALIANPIVINGGGGTDTLVFDSSAGNPIPSGAAGIRLNGGTGTFTLGGTAPTLDATHVVDLGTSTMNIPYTGTSPLPLVQGYLKNGFLESTDAAGSAGKFAIADTDTGSAIKLQYAVIGDTNVDGTVNFTDLLSLAQNYNKTGQDWAHGDFNYDGTVNFTDLLALAQHYNQSSAAVVAASSSSLDLLASARKAKPLARKR